MADSLILADQFELLGGGVASTIPACAGAVFRLAPGHDLSAPQPDANMVQTLLDGERPVGVRFSNRTPALPIVIMSPSRAVTAAAKEMLVRAISAEQFTLTWTRDSSLLPMVIDGYQAQATSVDYDLKRDKLAISNITLAFSAGPFGRSDVPAIVEFPTPLVGKTAAPAPVTLDDFTNAFWQDANAGTASNHHFIVTDSQGQNIAPGQRFQLYTSGMVLKEATVFTVASVGIAFAGFRNVQFTPNAAATVATGDIVKETDWTQSPLGPGPQSAHWGPVGSGAGQTATFVKAALTPVDLSAMNGLAVAVGFGSSSFFPHWGQRKAGPVTFAFTLSDGTSSATAHVTRRVKVSNNTAAPHWQVVQVPIPQGSGLNLAAVTGYTIKISSRQDGTLPYTDLYLDTVQGTPYARSGAVQPSYGVIYNLAGIAGSARSAFSLALQMPAGTSSLITKKFTTAGAMSWLAPAILIGNWAYYQLGGAGGRGGIGSGGPSNMTAGGGGGEGAGDKVPVTPGTQYAGSVPSGGSGNTGRASQASLAYDGGTMTAQGGGNVADNGTTGGVAGGPTWTPLQQLTGDTATFEGGIATWTGAGNCSVAQTAAQAHGGTKSLQLTSAASGDMTAASCTTANIKTQGDPCMAGIPVTVSAFARSAVSARSVQVGAEFYDVAGVSLGQLMGSSVADSTANFTTNPTATVTPPAGSVWLRRLARVVATGAGSEVHYFDDFSLKVGYAQAGGVGGAGNNTPSGGGGGGGGGGGTTGAGATGTAGSGSGAGGAAGAGSPPGGSGGQGGRLSTSSYPKKGNQAGGGGGGWEGGLLFPGGVQPTVKGGAGQINISWLQTTQFKSLVVHRPGFHMPDTFCPFVPIDQTDTPDGSTEYEVPQLIAGLNARYGAPGRPATFSLYAVAKSWANPGTARLITVQVNHYEQQGGTVYTKQVALTVTPNSLPSQLALLGEITLPDVAMPDDNLNSYFTWTITSAQTGDRFQELLMLDTMGSSVIVQSPTAYTSYFVDAPVGTDIGQVMGSQFDRGDAVSVLQYADVSGPPLHVDPLGNQSLLCYVADAQAPAAELNHYPAWMLERLA